MHNVLFLGHRCKTVRPMLSDRCPVCPVCDVGILWPNGWMNQDERVIMVLALLMSYNQNLLCFLIIRILEFIF